MFQAQQAANQQDANAGGMTASGVPITDQPFYQTESGEIDYDALMPPSVSDDDDDDDEEEDDGSTETTSASITPPGELV